MVLSVNCDQVDTYGLCVIVHMMLHGSYMEIEEKASSDGGHIYLPKTPFKRYFFQYCLLGHFIFHAKIITHTQKMLISLPLSAFTHFFFSLSGLYYAFCFRYWNADLWKNLFTKLLNNHGDNNKELLQNLRESFQDYMCSNPQMVRKLKELLAKQRASLCSN